MPKLSGKLCLIFSVALVAGILAVNHRNLADEPTRPVVDVTSKATELPSLADLKLSGPQRSRFRNATNGVQTIDSSQAAPQANIDEFKQSIGPLLRRHCLDCHGPELSEGNVHIDTLNPDILHGKDTDWWIEVFAVVTKGEMPPPDSSELGQADRQKIVEWLSTELQAASALRRQLGSRSSFRRLTRYEYNYALQDLLGLPWDFAKDLPPEPHTSEGFENSADLLQLTASQFETYHRLARQALARATILGDRPQTLRWAIPMRDAAAREWPKQNEQLEQAKKNLASDPEKLAAELARLEASFREPHAKTYYRELSTGRTALARWDYPEAKYAFAPSGDPSTFSADFDCVAIIPAGRNQDLVVELGNQLPDEGIMRVTARVSRLGSEEPGFPSIRLLFGWQASNEGRALLPVSDRDIPVMALPEDPQIVTWDVPLGEIYPRNTVRKTSPMGAIPSPSEYIRIANSSASNHAIQLDYVTVEAPYFAEWPPASHRRIFFASAHAANELEYAREIVSYFLLRAWRHPPTSQEVDRKMDLFSVIRPECDSFEEAVIEVLATILSSPQFLYVSNSPTAAIEASSDAAKRGHEFQLATRLSLFLWCSLPDEELLKLADNGELSRPDVLMTQVDRMLADPRSDRLSKNFVHQWLNLELLEFVNFQRRKGGFDPLLKDAMAQEPAAFFSVILKENASVLDFLHADYAIVNERLAKHYGLDGVYGNDFRRVPLDGNFQRGGILTQAGPLAMNSDWPDSHPLKRAIWLLERLLNDPPPPPPPAVPQIDLADPEIAKMTLKERIENHRNHAACNSCHAKIDPWGIAFENYDAQGRWRDQINGKPIDATSELFNHQKLDGVEGLKRHLLEARQDQFVEAMVHKLTTFALGRTLRFEDLAAIETITADVRNSGDGLATMIKAIVKNELFQSE